MDGVFYEEIRAIRLGYLPQVCDPLPPIGVISGHSSPGLTTVTRAACSPGGLAHNFNHFRKKEVGCIQGKDAPDHSSSLRSRAERKITSRRLNPPQDQRPVVGSRGQLFAVQRERQICDEASMPW